MPKISPGNIKLKNIANISFPPILACREDAPCKKSCYAIKAYKQYENVRNAWGHNFELAKHDRGSYFEGISAYLTKKNTKAFRWHVSGDILDVNYLDNMITVANNHIKTKFLAFTKQYELVLAREKHIPENLAIMLSAWPGFPLPKSKRFPISFMQDGTETRAAGAVECSGACNPCYICWDSNHTGENVVNDLH